MDTNIRLADPTPEGSAARTDGQRRPVSWVEIGTVGLVALAGTGLAFFAVRWSFLYAFAAILLLVGGIYLVRKPEIGLLAVVFAIPLEDFNLVGETPLLSAMKLLGIVALGAYMVYYMVFNRDEKLVWPVQNVYVLLLLLAMLASDLVAVDPAYAVDKTFKLVRMVSLYFLVINIERSMPSLHRILWVMITAGVFSAGYGFYEYFFRPETLEDMRISGTLDDPTGFAYAMVILIPLVWHMFKYSRNPWLRAGMLASGVMILYAIVLSGTRSGMLAAVAVMALIAAREKRPVLNMAAIAAVVVVGYLVAPEQVVERLGLNGNSDKAAQASTERRLTYLSFGTKLFLERPILGRGMGGFAETYSHSEYQFYLNDEDVRRIAHNMYLEIATGTGLIGLIPFLLLMFSPLIALERVVRAHRFRPLGEIAKMLQISLAAFLLIGFFSSSHYDKSLWLLLGLTTAVPLIAVEKANGKANGQKNGAVPEGF